METIDAYIPLIFVSILSILSIVLVFVGVQLSLTLIQLRKTLVAAEDAVDAVQKKAAHIIDPLQQLTTTALGVKAGMKALDVFSTWLSDGSRSKK